MQCKYIIKVRGDKRPLFSFIHFFSVKGKIQAYVEELLSSEEDLFLVDIVLKGNEGNQKLIVLIDGDHGVNIDKCAEISRNLGGWIEENDLIGGKYFLEVSSPGLDMPLTLHRQYQKNKGRSLKIQLNDGSRTKGKLLEILDDQLKVLDEKTRKEEMINMKDINKTFVEVSFK